MSLAVSQMDSVTQQNAALVEESAAAAASLEQQAEQLRPPWQHFASLAIPPTVSIGNRLRMLRKQPLQGVRHKTRIGKRFSRMLSCELVLINKHTKTTQTGSPVNYQRNPLSLLVYFIN